MNLYSFLDFIFIKFNQRILRPALRFLRKQGKRKILDSFLSETFCYGLNTDSQRKQKIIVSLTTIPSRFESVTCTLKSILNQTVKADKIVLWLGSDIDNIPESLSALEKYGVSFVKKDGNLMPHKKYYYAMQEFPEDIIITIDDDVIYDTSLIEYLLKTYKKHPDCICSNRVHFITKQANGNLHNYNNFINDFIFTKKPSFRLIATGVGGVLYPPHSIPNFAFSTTNIEKFCLRADDIYLKFVEAMNNVKVVRSPRKHFCPYIQIQNSQKICLSKTNVDHSENDKYIKNCENLFGTTLKELAFKK